MAQEYRATVFGAIADPTGAAVPNVKVVLANTDTGVVVTTASNNQGQYTVPFVLPGPYKLTVEVAGFKKYERSPIELKTNDSVRIDVTLDVGQVSERVEVKAAVPLLETASADRGQVVSNKSLSELPIQSRNPYTLMNLSTGVQYTGSRLYFRPFDVGALESYSINGGQSGNNAFQLDGVNINRAGSTGVGYTPPAEATQEFKVQTNTYDAQNGRTGGGTVSVSAKSGTNVPHGAAYWYLRRESLYANQFERNRAGLTKLNPQSVDQYGFEVDGPVILPKIYNGKDKTFFMVSMEKYKDTSPLGGAGAQSVPTVLEKAGNFSNSRTGFGAVTVIYDPLSIKPNPAYDPNRPITVSNPQYLRTPFGGNTIPELRKNPVAVKLLAAFPDPNLPGDANSLTNNFLGKNMLEINDYYNVISRVDHTLNSNWRMYGRWNRYLRKIYNPSGQAGYDTPASSGDWFATRGPADGAAFDIVGMLSPSTILNLRLGFTRFNGYAVWNSTYDQSALGLPSSLLTQLQTPDMFPVVSMAGYSGSRNPGDAIASPANNYSFQSNLTKVAGAHSMKFGFEYIVLQKGSTPHNLTQAGSYGFSRAWTSVAPDVNDSGASGNSIASMLLGYMSSASAAINMSTLYSWRVPALFLQDNWRVNSRLSLNMGLRWDYESPPVERFDQQVRGFDFSAQSPVQVPGYVLRGGLLFSGVGTNPRNAFNPDWNNFQPRFGIAYRLLKNSPLVFRAGFGLNYLPTTSTGQTTGFSSTTTATTSTADYLPAVTLSNPFPYGLIKPVGSSLGLATNLGDSITANNVYRTIPKMQQYSAGFEYELRPGWLVEASYSGSRTAGLPVTRDLNALSVSQLALGTSYLNTVVSNPFYGLLPVATSRGSLKTTQVRNLLVPYPQYSSVSMAANPLGFTWYNSVQLRLEKRFRDGWSILLSYTNSKNMDATQYKNAQDAKLSRELSGDDVPQRLVATGIFELPWGAGRKWLSQGVAGKILGGWQVSWSTTIQSGTPLSLPGNHYMIGDPKLPKSDQTIYRWFDTSPSLWVARPTDTLRTTQLRSPNIRGFTAPQIDGTLQRVFRIHELHRVHVRLSAFNATNTPILGGVNTDPSSSQFGVVTQSMTNLPRQAELSLKYQF